jgi:DNA-binding FrmR family transcriptional regulator
MPERVKKLEGQVEALAGLVEDLRGDIHELVSVLKEALNARSKAGVPQHVRNREPLGVC